MSRCTLSLKYSPSALFDGYPLQNCSHAAIGSVSIVEVFLIFFSGQIKTFFWRFSENFLSTLVDLPTRNGKEPNYPATRKFFYPHGHAVWFPDIDLIGRGLVRYLSRIEGNYSWFFRS